MCYSSEDYYLKIKPKKKNKTFILDLISGSQCAGNKDDCISVYDYIFLAEVLFHGNSNLLELIAYHPPKLYTLHYLNLQMKSSEWMLLAIPRVDIKS
jgi:hypothetical protein